MHDRSSCNRYLHHGWAYFYARLVQAVLEILSFSAGGEVMKSSKDEVSAKLAQLIDEIRTRCTIGYYPSVKQPKGKFCEIKLQVRAETEKREGQLLVRTKKG